MMACYRLALSVLCVDDDEEEEEDIHHHGSLHARLEPIHGSNRGRARGSDGLIINQ